MSRNTFRSDTFGDEALRGEAQKADLLRFRSRKARLRNERRHMMKTRTRLAVAAACLALAAGVASAPAAEAAKGDPLRLAMRKLWEDHITWTRLYIVSALADLPDKGATTDRRCCRTRPTSATRSSRSTVTPPGRSSRRFCGTTS